MEALAVRTRRKLRLLATFKSIVMCDTIEERAVEGIKPFVSDMKDYFKKKKLKYACEEYYRKVQFIQMRIKNSYIFRQNKIEGLLSYWDKILGKLG